MNKKNIDKREVLYQKLILLCEELIKREPPFDKIPQLKPMNSYYKGYIEFYNELEENFRDKIFEALLSSAKVCMDTASFGIDSTRCQTEELRNVTEKFSKWLQGRRTYFANVTLEEKPDVLKILRTEIPKYFPDFQFSQRLKERGVFPFSCNLCESTDVVLFFDQGSYGGSLELSIGLTDPKVLARLGDFYGGGSCFISYNTFKEFYEGLDVLFEILNFFLPKFKKTVREACLEWNKQSN